MLFQLPRTQVAPPHQDADEDAGHDAEQEIHQAYTRYMSTPPPSPGNLILWLLAVILFIVLLALILSVADVHID